jgi:hypothetical protein
MSFEEMFESILPASAPAPAALLASVAGFLLAHATVKKIAAIRTETDEKRFNMMHSPSD